MSDSRSETTSGLRRLGLAFTVLGAVASLVFMFLVGRRNQSSFLMALFAGWITLPFVGLGLADRWSATWPKATRDALHGLMLVVPALSVLVYGYVAFNRIPLPPAAPFLMVPLGSWMGAAVSLFVASRLPGKSTRDR